jgi:hypothetical protein
MVRPTSCEYKGSSADHLLPSMTAGTNVDAGGWPVLAVLLVMFEIPDVSEGSW